MTAQLPKPIHLTAIFATIILLWAWSWPIGKVYMLGQTIRDYSIPESLFVALGVFAVLVVAAMTMRLRPTIFWTLISAELLTVVAMTILLPWAGISHFLIIIAWQVAVATTTKRALAWTVFQTLAVVAGLAQAISPDLCWVITKSFAMQLLLLFLARGLKKQVETARALAQTNRELRSAQAIIANTVRDAERLRISRELHDAWGHELTALGLQLEIASNVDDRERANDHVLKAKSLSRALLAKVRDVVATLREDDRYDLNSALETLAASVPTPAIHVAIAPEVKVGPAQAHALVRCAQEAVTNAVRHADAVNLWLQVTRDGDGVRLVARDDGRARAIASKPGSGLVGMRERIETLGGKLAIRPGDVGFTIDAWLPARMPQPA